MATTRGIAVKRGLMANLSLDGAKFTRLDL